MARRWTFSRLDARRRSTAVAVRAKSPGLPDYVVDVELTETEEGYVCTGIAVRNPKAGQVSARDVRRLALTEAVDGAIAWLRGGVHAPKPPRGRPNGLRWYQDFAAAVRAFQARGESPTKGIVAAKRAMGETVDDNLVHQWIWRCTHKLNLLDPPARRVRLAGVSRGRGNIRGGLTVERPKKAPKRRGKR